MIKSTQFLFLSTLIQVSALAAGPKVPGYSRRLGVFCPAAPDGEKPFPASFSNCIRACSSNVTCTGVNFELASTPDSTSTCQLLKTFCAKEEDLQRPTLGSDVVFYSKGETHCDKSNAGNDFVFAFMSNRPQQPRKMNLKIFVAHNYPIAGTLGVTMELFNQSKSSKTTKFVHENKPQFFELDPSWKMSDLVKRGGGIAVIEKKAVKISSDDGSKIYAIGANEEHFTGDTFLALPVSALGQRYYVACHSPAFYACEFAVASANFLVETLVNITLPLNDTVKMGDGGYKSKTETCKVKAPDGKVYTNGDTFQVTLGAFEVIQVQDACDLTGTLIESSRPVAVFSGNVRASVGADTFSRDHLAEQLLPSNAWGIDCAMTATPGRSAGDFWLVTASQPETVVEIWNGPDVKEVLNLPLPGSSYRFRAEPYSNIYFKANKPIQAVSFIHSQLIPEEQADPSMTICTSSSQFDYGYTFVTPTNEETHYRTFLTVIIEEGLHNQLSLNGKALIPENWEKFYGTNYVSAHFDIAPSGVHTLLHSRKNVRFGAYVYGTGDRASFSYPTGTCADEMTCEKSVQTEIADGLDNDCDMFVDEEVCDGKDDDGDGQIDEDCYVSRIQNDRISLPKRFITLPMKKSAEKQQQQCYHVRNAIGCYNAKVELTCDGFDNSNDMRVKVLSAHFGRIGYRDEYTCNSGNPVGVEGREVNCGLRDVYWPIAQSCDNQTSCSYHVHLYELGDVHPYNSRCQLCHQYAVVQYMCVRGKDVETLTLAGRTGAESPDRYWASSSSFGSAAMPVVDPNSCDLASAANSACYRPPDEMLDSSRRSWTLDTTGPPSARFSSSSTQAWCPAFCDRQDGWLVVDLGGHYEVTGYMIQGRRAEEQWVSSIRLAYSVDGSKWSELRNFNGSWISFPANYDARSIVACSLHSYKIIARFMRIFVNSYSGQPCLHVDFFRQNKQMGCSPKTIQNSNIDKEPGRRGTTLTVQCKRGWETEDRQASYTIRCGAKSGLWEGDARPCSKLVSCSDIPLVDGSLHNGRHTRPGSRVDYTCLDGRSLVGNSTIFCGTDGEWQPYPPKCTY